MPVVVIDGFCGSHRGAVGSGVCDGAVGIDANDGMLLAGSLC